MNTTRDIQACADGFPKIAINKVGVRNIELPINLVRPNGESFYTQGVVSSYCDLVENLKGINMSRIPRTISPVFTEKDTYITEKSAKAAFLLQKAHGTNHIYLKVKFKYSWKSLSPTTEIDSYETANVEIETKLNDGIMRQYLTVETVGMSLCPCSKEMSMLWNNFTSDESDALLEAGLPASVYQKLHKAGFGAHNQKSFVKVTVELGEDIVWIEDIVNIINTCVSSPTYSILKRPDEKYVTEVSYMSGYFNDKKEFVEVSGYGPKFVEDIARQVAEKLDTRLMGEWISDYVVVVRNQESIHSNDIEAVAVLSAGKDLG